MRKQNKKHFVIIQWGEMPDCGSEEHYTFDSEAELNAFMLGVAEAEGWHGYEVIRTGAYHD